MQAAPEPPTHPQAEPLAANCVSPLCACAWITATKDVTKGYYCMLGWHTSWVARSARMQAPTSNATTTLPGEQYVVGRQVSMHHIRLVQGVHACSNLSCRHHHLEQADRASRAITQPAAVNGILQAALVAVPGAGATPNRTTCLGVLRVQMQHVQPLKESREQSCTTTSNYLAPSCVQHRPRRHKGVCRESKHCRNHRFQAYPKQPLTRGRAMSLPCSGCCCCRTYPAHSEMAAAATH